MRQRYLAALLAVGGWLAGAGAAAGPAIEMPDGEPVPRTAQRVAGTGAYRRGLIVIRAGTTAPAGGEDAVPALAAPRAGAPRAGHAVPLFKLVYIYADAGPFRLVGTGPQSSTATPLLGWVPARRVCAWDTRLAVELVRPATVWRSAADAYGEFKAAAGTAGALITGAKPNPAPGAMRFPLLPWAGDETFQPVHPLHRAELLKIGWIIAQPDNRRAVAALEQTLDAIRAEAESFDLVFVINATGGMLKYEDALVKAVDQIHRSARAAGAKSLRMSFNYFWDFLDDEQYQEWRADAKARPVQTAPLAEVDGPRFGQVLDRLRARVQQSTSGGGVLDQLYWGVAAALDDARPNPKAQRLVIALSDSGNNDRYPAPPTARATVDGIVARLFAGGGTATDFLAVHLEGKEPYNEQFVQPYAQFKTDAGRIIERMRARPGLAAPASGKYVLARDRAELTLAIQQRFMALQAKAEDLRRQIDAARRGVGVGKLPPSLLAHLALYDIQPADIEKLRAIYQEGYVWKQRVAPAGLAPQARVVVLLDRAEIAQLCERIDAVLQAPPAQTAPRLHALATTQLALVLGEHAPVPAGGDERAARRKGWPVPYGLLDQLPTLARSPGLRAWLTARRDRLGELLEQRPGEPDSRAVSLTGEPGEWYWWVDLERELPWSGPGKAPDD